MGIQDMLITLRLFKWGPYSPPFFGGRIIFRHPAGRKDIPHYKQRRTAAIVIASHRQQNGKQRQEGKGRRGAERGLRPSICEFLNGSPVQAADEAKPESPDRPEIQPHAEG